MLAFIGLLVVGLSVLLMLLVLPVLLPVGLLLMVFPLGLALLAFWIWMLIEAIQNKGLTDSERIVWVLVIVFLHLLGAFIYLLAGYSKRKTPLKAA
jgi:Phospholipase_D-nuclease N-terminal